MISKVCFTFIAFCFIAVSISTIFLRSANNRICYEIMSETVTQDRLHQQLWQKQLELESLVNPAAISQRLER
jgi:hypothetical protein